MSTGERELQAMAQVLEVLSGLDDDERARVLTWAGQKFGASTSPTTSADANQIPNTNDYAEIGDLYHLANPRTDSERALVAAYWFQQVQGQKDFRGQEINTALKNLGFGVGNITNALSGLLNESPRLAIQTRKEGRTQQARKTYKLTDQGIRRVRAMLQNQAAEESGGA